MLFFLLSVYFSLALIGCALRELQRDIQEKEQRIPIKEEELKNLEKQQSILEEEKKSLLSDLDNKQMTLNNLYARLKNLRRENAHLKTYTAQQRKKQMNFEVQTQQYMNEIDTIKNNDQISNEEKNKRIQELKNQIRDNLKLGL
jgi:chromosome segregation ATPase